MKIIRNKFIPFDGFAAINICGLVFTKKKTLSDKTINHEEIHTLQMKELWYIGFYLIYCLEYLIYLICGNKPHAAYRKISFEQEAYMFEKVSEYPRIRKKYTWVLFLLKNLGKKVRL